MVKGGAPACVLCVCVCARARACVRACVRACGMFVRLDFLDGPPARFPVILCTKYFLVEVPNAPGAPDPRSTSTAELHPGNPYWCDGTVNIIICSNETKVSHVYLDARAVGGRVWGALIPRPRNNQLFSKIS